MAAKLAILGPDHGSRLGDRLLENLVDHRWTSVKAAVAYAKMSGVCRIAAHLYDVAPATDVRITVGIDQQGTSLEGLQTLWLLLSKNDNSLYVLHNPNGNPSPTFHPKTWLFSNTHEANLIVGSGNLTSGGLYTNYELGVEASLDLSDPDQLPVFQAVDGILANWSDEQRPEVTAVNEASLRAMYSAGELPTEAAIRRSVSLSRAAKALLAGLRVGGRSFSGLFSPSKPEPAPPVVPL